MYPATVVITTQKFFLFFLQCTALQETRGKTWTELYTELKREQLLSFDLTSGSSAIESHKQQQSCQYRMITTTIDLCLYLLFDNAALKEERSNVGQYFVNRRNKSCELHGEAPVNGVKMNAYGMPHCEYS